MMDIIVTLPKRYGLKHLQEKIAAISSPTWGEAWWDFRRFPKKLESFDRVFIVCEGMIRGSFEAHYPDPETGRVYFSDEGISRVSVYVLETRLGTHLKKTYRRRRMRYSKMDLKALQREMEAKKQTELYQTNANNARDVIDYILALKEERVCEEYPDCRTDSHPNSCPQHPGTMDPEGWECLPDFACCARWLEDNHPGFLPVFQGIVTAREEGRNFVHVKKVDD